MKGYFNMMIDTNTVVSMTEANQNFSKVSRIVDEYGRAVIFKNNAPRYLVIQFVDTDKVSNASVPDALASAERMMDRYDDAFRELAK